MLERFKTHINKSFPDLAGKKILIAISGGVDSVVLTYLFYQLKFDIVLAHCNFQLRGLESDLDETFVKNLAESLNTKVHSTKFDTEVYAAKNKLSTQVAARELRYNWFQELAEIHEYEYITTAHHADDNLETFLINFTRGTGLEGLTGIPKKNNNIIRPLLPFSREEILEYAQTHNILWREDTSNASKKYLRNKLRLEVIPILKEINPNLLHCFANTIQHLEETQRIVDKQVKHVADKVISIEGSITKFSIQELLKLPNPKAYLFQFLKSYSFNEWDKVYDLIFAQSGKYISTKTHRLLKNRDFLLFSPTENGLKNDTVFKIEKDSKTIDYPVQLKIEKNNQTKLDSKKAILVDENLLFFPLIIRKWKTGDAFYPTGMQGKKKVSKFYKDEKLSLLDKENTWLLCNANDEVIWIIGQRQDRRFSIRENTNNIIKISIV